MILVFGLAALIWGIGHLFGAPRQARLYMLGLLYVAVLALHLILPDGHPVRLVTGQSAALWLILGGFVLLALAYNFVLGRVRGEARLREAASTPAPVPGQFAEGELDRYARHVVLRELGGPGQKRLKTARVLVVGAGGLGSPAMLYLAAAGIGTIGVIDDDAVDAGNLQRQIIHRDAHLGMPKVFSAEIGIKAINPYVAVKPYHRRFTEEIAEELLTEYDLVLDGSDNFDTRYLVNRAAVTAGLPLVSGALSQWEGQISVFDPATQGPCYRCLFPEAPAAHLTTSCAEAGVLGPLPGVIGAMMAVEAVKQITGAGAVLCGEMLIYDALWGETRRITLKRRSDCADCGTVHSD